MEISVEPILSPRLRLWLLQLTDAPDLFAYAQDPEVARFTSWEAHRRVEDSTGFIRHVLARHSPVVGALHLVWGIHLKTARGVIGTISFTQANKAEGRVDYALAKAHWGQGIMTEAVQVVIDWAFQKIVPLERIHSGCLSQNEGSVRVLLKCGFQETNRYLRVHEGKFGPKPLETVEFCLHKP